MNDADTPRGGAPDAPGGGDAAGDKDWYLPEDSRRHLRELFAGMRDEVVLEAYTRAGENDPYNEAMTLFLHDLRRLGDRIVVRLHDVDSEEAARRGVTRSPTLLVAPERYAIRYTGAPLGEEARVLVETVMLASAGRSGLSDMSRRVLADLAEPREVRVFISPTCPYCPGQVTNAFRAALECPGLVRAECVETGENQDLAERYQATALPLTVVNETFRQKGLMPEERFAIELVELHTVEELFARMDAEGPQSVGGAAGELLRQARDGENAPGAAGAPEAEEFDVIVAGAGPAGLTAAIYTERSGLKTLVLEKGAVGGQVLLTPEVENYPGFKRVGGIQLMEMIAAQAREYCTVREGEPAQEIKIGRAVEVFTPRGRYRAKALVLATGSSAKRLGVPGETQFFGKGVSVCASCDGWAYKGREVVMIGGGNTALTEALHLKNMGVGVTVVHRRDAFRAERHLQKGVEQAGIPVLWNTEVEEFVGGEGGLSAVRLRNVADGTTSELAVHGAFLAIGWNPNTELARQIGVRLDAYGCIEVDRGMRTNIPRVYACGDVIGGVQQIATAVGEGSTAALAVFEDIANPYWLRPEDG
ncbi:FAD-dependent oxidoreductase [Desulfocurvus sp.]|uniref:FAD-dependent oxidoreductase n=1 Tax=Desulfocurvus sp. TaxID=2871698 RepID=UPI0025C565F3|nr:FAD-dependent oxidoreductase [Desulfocurvus sp.]MCK9238912.1 FAD-dependent oxidoreductase [Desulfocurvus sp.]